MNPTTKQWEFWESVFSHRFTLYGGAAGGGKALALDTPIATPSGWTSIGEIRPGDRVFDEVGRSCNVIAATPIQYGHPIYDVVFDDGSIIRADGSHEWQTRSVAERSQMARRTPEYRAARRAKREGRGNGSRPDLAEMNAARAAQAVLSPAIAKSIHTTEEIGESLWHRGRCNHSIDCAKPIQGPEVYLPIDPYVLGLWLGDGCRSSAQYSCAEQEIIDGINQAGFATSKYAAKYTYGILGLHKLLRVNGLLDNKHIPRIYLRASERQRRALLAGLMDTDGTCLPSGSCEFYNCNLRLADDAQELITSLGYKVSRGEGRATLYGKDCGPKYRLKFTTSDPIFRLKRKLNRQIKKERGVQRRRFIVDVRPVPSQPVRCIQVDSPSSLYLAGERMIPTHNSFIMRWTLVYLLAYWGSPVKEGGLGLKGVRVALFCEDYPSLHDRQISKILMEFPEWLGTYREQPHEFTLSAAYGGGVICFRNLDDPSKYLSAEFGAVCVDELTRNEEKVFDFLRMRLRWPGIEETKFMAATNPGGIGHQWVKRLWIDRDFPPGLRDRSDQFAYVRALATDNPHNAASYLTELASLPPNLRAAYYEGLWSSFAGQVFAEWREEIHVVSPFEIPSWWRRWGSNDPGYTDPSVWYWFAADQDGNIYCYREATFYSIVPSEQARQVNALSVRREGGHEIPERIESWVTGMDAFVMRDRHSGKTDVDYYMQGGLSNFQRPVHGPGARASRCKTIHEYLRPFPGADGKPTARLKVFSNCKKLIETLPALGADRNDPEKYAECAIDHWGDSCFVAGTMVLTSMGNVPIETVKAGDSAWTRDGFHKILKAGLTTPLAMVYDLWLDNGQMLTGTRDHPILVVGKGWIRLIDLQPGDEVEAWPRLIISSSLAQSALSLFQPTNTVPRKHVPAPVVLVLEVSAAGMAKVYNLTVEGQPEYFANGVLVHNCGYGLGHHHAGQSVKPAAPDYVPGSAGDMLKHAEVLRPKPKRVEVFR